MPVFKARVYGRGVASVLYRVYVRGDDLLFIRVETGTPYKGLATLGALLGPAGGLVHAAFSLWSGTKSRNVQAHIEERDPEELLREDEENFTVYIPEIRNAALKPPFRLTLSGSQTGRLELSLPDGRTMKLDFLAVEDLNCATKCLAPRLALTGTADQ